MKTLCKEAYYLVKCNISKKRHMVITLLIKVRIKVCYQDYYFIIRELFVVMCNKIRLLYAELGISCTYIDRLSYLKQFNK